MHEIVRGLINWLVSGLIEGTVEAAAGLTRCRRGARCPERVARFTPDAAAGTRELKVLLPPSCCMNRERLAEAPAGIGRADSSFIRVVSEASGADAGQLPRRFRRAAAAPAGVRLHRRHDRPVPAQDVRANEDFLDRVQPLVISANFSLAAAFNSMKGECEICGRFWLWAGRFSSCCAARPLLPRGRPRRNRVRIRRNSRKSFRKISRCCTRSTG